MAASVQVTQDDGLVLVAEVAAPVGPQGVQGPGGTTLTKADVIGTGLTVSDIGGTLSAYQFKPETYGAVGDGTTNDAAAIRAAVNAAVAFAQAHTFYAEVVFDPSKTYVVNGSLQQGGATKGNALIPLPVVAPTAHKVTLVLRGSREAGGLLHWQQTVAQSTGAVLKTTVTGSNDATYGEASVLGGPTPKQGYPVDGAAENTFSNMLVVVDGLCVQLPDDPHICGFDLRGVAEASIPNASAFTTGTPGAFTLATQSWQFGLAMPYNNNNAICKIGSYSAEMQNFGVRTSEHTVAEAIYGIYCVAAVEHGGGGSDGSTAHGSIFNYICAEACAVGLGFVGGSWPTKIEVGLLDVENNSFADLNDPSDVAIGTVGITGIGALPTAGPLTIRGAGQLRVIELHRQTGWAGVVSVPATTVALRNPFWRDAAVNVSGGTVTVIAVDGHTTGLTSGTVIVPTGRNITLTYSVAPTWNWTIL